jgi:hypothetical protein
VIYDVGSRADLGAAPTGSCAEAEQVQSAGGCLFWGVDLPNSREGAQGGDAESQQYAIVVANNSADVSATVRVFVGDEPQSIDEIVVAPEGTHAFELPAASIDPEQSSSDGVAYRVESDVPITAYQFNPLENILVYSNDATVLWPDHALTTDYTAVTDDATSLAPTFVSVVATVDGTHVEAFPTTELAIVGAPEAVIDRGEVFTIISLLADAEPTNAGNLSGTRIVADQPVAAFSGNVTAPIIPAGAGWVGGSRICCADHMEHQLIPLQAWGRSYAVATPAPAYYAVDPARYRISGAFDDTALVYDPVAPAGAPTSIDGGETLVFETDLSFTVTSGDPAKPFAVTQFLPSGDTTESLFDDERRGDPAMIMLPAREQFQDKYVFAVPDAYAINRLTIVAEEGATIELDGAAIGAELEPLGTLDGSRWPRAGRGGVCGWGATSWWVARGSGRGGGWGLTPRRRRRRGEAPHNPAPIVVA